MRWVLNTDYTDYTDFLWRLDGFLWGPWCVRVLNWDCADPLWREGNGVRASWPLPSLASERADESLGFRWVCYLFCLTYFFLI